MRSEHEVVLELDNAQLDELKGSISGLGSDIKEGLTYLADILSHAPLVEINKSIGGIAMALEQIAIELESKNQPNDKKITN